MNPRALQLGWIYLFVLIVMTGGGYYLGGVENQLVNACRVQAVSNAAARTWVAAQVQNAVDSRLLTSAQKSDRVDQGAHFAAAFPIVQCPHHVF